MTSRRSMLKWIPAVCVGGWWGLGHEAAALPACSAKAASPPPAPPQPNRCELANGTIRYTIYDEDGRIVAMHEYNPHDRPKVTHYEYYGCSA
jgi:hypothetical protein